MSRFRTLPGEDFVAYALPLVLVAVLALMGMPLVWATVVGWTVLATLERLILGPPQVHGSPSVVEEAAALRVRVPVHGWLGSGALIAGLGAVGLVVFTLFQGGMSFAELLAVPVGGVLLGLALTGLTASTVVVRVDPERRRVTVQQSLFRRRSLVLGEVTGVEGRGSQLVIGHTGGEQVVDLAPHWDSVVANLARQLDTYARAHGADPDAARLKYRAASALSEVRRPGDAP